MNLKCDEDKSLAFLYPEIAKNWHPTKNNNLLPIDFDTKSRKRIWFRCPKITCQEQCPHDFEAQINNVVNSFCNSNTNGCPCCSCRVGKVCKHLSLAYLFPNIVAELHPTKNNFINTEIILPNSSIELWFLCPHTFECGCEHAYLAMVKSRTRKTTLKGSPTGCPYCTHKKFCIHSTLVTTHLEMALEWDLNLNDDTPCQFSYGSRKVVSWVCPNNNSHKYECAIRDRTLGGNGCKSCHGTTEAVLNEFLVLLKNQKTNKLFNIKWDCGFDWCLKPTTKNKLRFDFFIKDLNLLVELDGEQHFEDIKHFKTTREEEVSNDVYKMICAIDNGYSIIRVIKNDVKHNKNDWQNKLIELIKNCNIITPSVYYIDSGNLYDNHKQSFDKYIEN
jgi:hypothetical protein